MLVLLILGVFAVSFPTGDAALDACLEVAADYCKDHQFEIEYICTTDGERFSNRCHYYIALCHNKTLKIVHTGSACRQGHTHIIPHTTTRPLGHFETTLFSNLVHGIDDRLIRSNESGIDPKVSKPIFKTQDYKNSHYVRNTECWAYGLDLTMISPWNSNHGVRKAGTLITPKHAVWARHYNMPLNTTIRFVDANNNVVDRRIVREYLVDRHGGHSFFGRDIVLGELDSDVPSTISHAKVLPAKDNNWHPPISTRIPVLSTDFEEKALVTDLYYISNKNVGLRTPDHKSLEYLYYESKIVGDSGNPTFLIVNNELVLIFVFTTGGAGGGTSLTHYHDELNTALMSWGGGYKLTDVDLTGFLDTHEVIPNLIG